MRRKLNDLLAQRNQFLTDAENALNANDKAAYDAAKQKIDNINADIKDVQDLIAEQDKKFGAAAPTGAEAKDMAEERGSILMKGGEVKFTAKEVKLALTNSTTLATGTLVQPTGAGSAIRDPLGNVVSSIVDQVSVLNLTGMSSYLEPYVISEIDAKHGKVADLAGKARTESADPTFGVAEIKPYELNVTSYVDRNISRLSPADYYGKIYAMTMRAMRRQVAQFIVNSSGGASPDMHGIKTAKNRDGAAIYQTLNVTGIHENLLSSLYFAYGSDEAIGANARLLLTKQDLKALGELRGTNEKKRLFEIVPDAGNPNTGTIRDGGVVLPYTIVSGLTSLATATAGASAIQTMLYGDPANYELGLFGDYTIRVDESVKAVERMTTILGDAFLGGNLVVDKGFVVATLPAKT